MKKLLSVLSLVAILGLVQQVQAAPNGGEGHGGGAAPAVYAGAGMGKGVQPIRHHIDAPRGHYHRSNAVIGGVLARRSCRCYPYCDYRLGCCGDYYYNPPYYGGSGIYVNLGIPLHF